MQMATNRFKKSTEHQVWNKSINEMACPVLSRPRPRSWPSLVAPAGRPPSAVGRPGGSLKAFDWVVGELTTDENGPRRQETASAGPGPGQLDGLAMDWSVFFSLPRSQFMFGQLMLFPLTFPFSSFLQLFLVIFTFHNSTTRWLVSSIERLSLNTFWTLT
jgi:hypothetical protein